MEIVIGNNDNRLSDYGYGELKCQEESRSVRKCKTCQEVSTDDDDDDILTDFYLYYV